MTIEDKLLSIKHKLDSLAQKRDRRAWEVEQLEKELLDKYGLKTVDAALKEAESAKAKAEALRSEAEARLRDIQDKYSALLEMA